MKPPGYIVENVCTQDNNKTEVVRVEATQIIFNQLGTPVKLDAARFGSYAHRTRNFWTNLAPVPTWPLCEMVLSLTPLNGWWTFWSQAACPSQYFSTTTPPSAP